jgi:thiol-disulfide isomerase/thioredoxin
MLTGTNRGRLFLAALLLASAVPVAPLSAQNLHMHEWPASARTPALTLPGVDGKRWDLRSLRGKVVVLNFWASWCGPCVDELPVLNELARRPSLRGKLIVLGINYKEGADAIDRFTHAHSLQYPLLRDRSGEAFKQWTSGVMPTTVLIDRAGRARWRMIGELDPADPAFMRALDALLQQ